MRYILPNFEIRIPNVKSIILSVMKEEILIV